MRAFSMLRCFLHTFLLFLYQGFHEVEFEDRGQQHANIMLFFCGQMGNVPERITAFRSPERPRGPSENKRNPSGVIYIPLGPTDPWKNTNKTQS